MRIFFIENEYINSENPGGILSYMQNLSSFLTKNNNKTDYARINFMTCFKEPCSGDNIIEEFVYFQE